MRGISSFSRVDGPLLKLEDDFATTLPLSGVCNGGFEFTQWISFLDFRFQQTALRHFKNRSKRLHALRRSGVVVPFVDPDAAKAQVFENEKASWNFQWLQAHRSKAHQCATERETICETERAVATDGVQS